MAKTCPDSVLKVAGRAAGIEVADDGADYWSPTSITMKPGTIIATRSRTGDTGMANALLYVRSIGENNALELVIAQAPPQPGKPRSDP